MFPSNLRLLESAARELRALRRDAPAAFVEVVAALKRLARQGPPRDARRFPVEIPAVRRREELILFGFDVAGRRVLFEAEDLVTRTVEGWELVRGLPRAGGGYTVWAIVQVSDRDDRGGL